jgi:hypothetical protein
LTEAATEPLPPCEVRKQPPLAIHCRLHIVRGQPLAGGRVLVQPG